MTSDVLFNATRESEIAFNRKYFGDFGFGPVDASTFHTFDPLREPYEFWASKKIVKLNTQQENARTLLLTSKKFTVMLHDGTNHPESHSYPPAHPAITL